MPRQGYKNLTVKEDLHHKLKKIAEKKNKNLGEIAEDLLTKGMTMEVPAK